MSQGADGNPTVAMIEAAFRHHDQPLAGQVPRPQPNSALPHELDLTRLPWQQTRDGAQDRGLARPRRRGEHGDVRLGQGGLQRVENGVNRKHQNGV